MKMYRFILAAAMGLASASALAASNGTLSVTSSSGDFDIDLEIPALVVVTGLDDIDLGTFAPGSDSTGSNTFCVYSNQGTIDVDVLVEPGNTPGAGTAPVLQSGTVSTEIPYTLDLNGTGSLLTSILAAGGTASSVDGGDGVQTALGGTGPTSYTCTESFSFDVTVAQADATAATAAADYTDTVTVTVTPN